MFVVCSPQRLLVIYFDSVCWQFNFIFQRVCSNRTRMSCNKPLFDDRIKPKNVLALNEKVAAIRCYEANPVYKQIGRMFNCSPDQIKRIVNTKEEILAEWENRTRKPVAPTTHQIKTVRMSFLGKAVHEWIRRIMYYTDFNLNDILIKTMAMEFAKVLKIHKFQPTKEWVAHFRTTYKLPDANTKTMTIGYQESHSVQILDILRYVSSECNKKTNESDDPNYFPELNDSNASSELNAIVSEAAIEMIKIENDEDYYCDEVKVEEEEIAQSSCYTAVVESQDENTVTKVQSVVEIPGQVDCEMQDSELLMPKEEPNTEIEGIADQEIESQSETTVPHHENEPELEEGPVSENITDPNLKKVAVHTLQGALSCVKLLEDFALLKENFRLIGLIERLEEALNGGTK